VPVSLAGEDDRGEGQPNRLPALRALAGEAVVHPDEVREGGKTRHGESRSLRARFRQLCSCRECGLLQVDQNKVQGHRHVASSNAQSPTLADSFCAEMLWPHRECQHAEPVEKQDRENGDTKPSKSSETYSNWRFDTRLPAAGGCERFMSVRAR